MNALCLKTVILEIPLLGTEKVSFKENKKLLHYEV